MESTVKMNKDGDKFIMSFELYDQMHLPVANGKGVFILDDIPPFQLLYEIMNHKGDKPLGPFECYKIVEPDHDEEYDETLIDSYCETVNDAFNYSLDFIHNEKSPEVAKHLHETIKFN